MKKSKNKGGFTLVELIVALIILGVLAAIALPLYFNWVNQSKGAEAMAELSTYKDLMETCGNKSSPPNWTSCQIPGGGSSQTEGSYNFDYMLGDSTCNLGSFEANFGDTNGWCLRAMPGGWDVVNFIELQRSSSTGPITCQGGGEYLGIC